ncbi:MAG: EpsI family protein [Acidobacteria bacterium]|nr:EpsI family protein [Acidobacteriota bacterium]
MPGFFSTPGLATFSALIAIQGAAGFYLNARNEYVPQAKPLAEFPTTIESWTIAKEFQTEAEVQAVLKADDTLSRVYTKPGGGQGIYFWIAYFQSQRAGRAPRSPKNCLPGNGWVKERNTIITIPVPGRAEPIEAQYYLVQRGEAKSIVIYWYQSHGRVVADEYTAKYYVVADAIRYNRTDTALVKFTVPASPEGAEKASELAIQAVKAFYPAIAATLPN